MKANNSASCLSTNMSTIWYYQLVMMPKMTIMKVPLFKNNNDYLNKQVSHLILHFINEKFNASQDLRLRSVQN